MTPDDQFWWNWWVSAAVVFGTLAVVLVALFGQAFRSKFFPPRLTLRLAKPEGEKARVRLTGQEQGEPKERWEDARYYHLRVSNKRRWSPASNVQVFLIRIEEQGPDGEFQVVWTGDVPMRWRNQEVFPVARTIGPSTDSDLCSIVKSKELALLPLITPYNLETKRHQKNFFVLSLQARANEVDSPVLRVQIAWDGGWEDGDQEMERHMVVKALDQQEI